MSSQVKNPSTMQNEQSSTITGGFDQMVFDQAEFDQIINASSPFLNEIKH